MLKKLGLVISITLAMVLGFGLTGCSDSETASASEIAEGNGLVQVSRTNFGVDTNISNDGFIYTFYDPDTYVMYMFIYTIEGASCQPMVMVNPDGTPKLYEPQN